MKSLICGVLVLVLNGSQAVAADAKRADLFRQELRTLETALDRGASAEQAVRDFGQSLQARNLTVGDVEAYLSQEFTPRELSEFRSELHASLRGIPTEELSSQERAEVALRAALKVQGHGLSWSPNSCKWANRAIWAAGIGLAVYGVAELVHIYNLNKPFVEQRRSIRAQYDPLILDAKERRDEAAVSLLTESMNLELEPVVANIGKNDKRELWAVASLFGAGGLLIEGGGAVIYYYILGCD